MRVQTGPVPPLVLHPSSCLVQKRAETPAPADGLLPVPPLLGTEGREPGCRTHVPRLCPLTPSAARVSPDSQVPSPALEIKVTLFGLDPK